MKNLFIYYPKSVLVIMLLSLSSLFVTGCNSTGSSNESSSGDDGGMGNTTGNPMFNSGNISADKTFSFTFKEEGTVEYYCKIHAPNMQGKVTVSSQAQSAATDTVRIKNNEFVPSTITVAPNTKVVWINNDNFDHTVSQGKPSSSNNGY